MIAAVVKECRCGAKYTAETWLSLPFCGHQTNGAGGVLFLRNCTCGSTLAVEVEETGARELMMMLVRLSGERRNAKRAEFGDHVAVASAAMEFGVGLTTGKWGG